jgi:aerobic carbon-monoxide dehydrogenase medium subunit
VKSAPFEYHVPTTPEEAVSMLAQLGDTAKPLAGGQSLVPMLALRLAVFEHLVDVGRVEQLHGIERGNDSVRIAGSTTQAAIERSADVAATVPLLARATPLIGHFQIRNRGTIGGSIAHADPAAEYPAVALTLEAQLEVLSTAGRRTVPATEFFTGMWSSALGDDELLTAVTFPVWSGRCGFAVREFTRRHGDFAIAGAAIAVELDDDDRVRRCNIGLLGLGPTPERASAAEAALHATTVDDIDGDEVGRLAVSTLESVPSDLHGSSTYRRRVGAAMAAAAWLAASEEARHG